MDGELGCVHFEAAVNGTAVKTSVKCLCGQVFISSQENEFLREQMSSKPYSSGKCMFIFVKKESQAVFRGRGSDSYSTSRV